MILFHNASWIAEKRQTGIQKMVGSLAAAGWVGVTSSSCSPADQAWVTSVGERQIYYWTYLSNWVRQGIVGLGHFWSLASRFLT